jgi:hypothetical protein
MKVKALTKREAAWIKRAQRCFNAAPDRFAFLTIGDCNLTIVDADGAKESALADGQHTRDGIDLGTIFTKTNVHGVSG